MIIEQVVKGEELTDRIQPLFALPTGEQGFIIKTYGIDGLLEGTFYVETVGNTGTFTDCCSGDTIHGSLKCSPEEILEEIKRNPDDWQICSVLDED